MKSSLQRLEQEATKVKSHKLKRKGNSSNVSNIEEVRTKHGLVRILVYMKKTRIIKNREIHWAQGKLSRRHWNGAEAGQATSGHHVFVMRWQLRGSSREAGEQGSLDAGRWGPRRNRVDQPFTPNSVQTSGLLTTPHQKAWRGYYIKQVFQGDQDWPLELIQNGFREQGE